MTSNEHRVRVLDAAHWLDGAYPGWADKIDLSNFRMEDSEICIGGYLDVSWYFDLKCRYGAEMGLTDVETAGIFAAFTDAWRDAIEWRQVAVNVPVSGESVHGLA